MSILDEIDLSPSLPAAAAGTFRPSEFQQAIFDEMSSTEDVLIQAVAGSGKTTTLIEATKRTRGSNLFMAFNKSIAADILAKGAEGTVKTLNAMGHSVVMRNRGGELNARKVPDLIKSIMGETSDHREHGYAISRLVGLAKNLALGIEHPADTGDFCALVEASDIPAEFAESAVAIAFEAFEQSRLDTICFDFDDQLWLPISEGWTFPQFSNVFVDEAQDLSPIQHEMLLRFSSAKIVCVGDRHQAIYGFRGASHNSMDELKEMFTMRELPLSVCYRCPREVILYAQEFCPEITWRDNAPEGKVAYAESDPLLFPDSQFILCRNNAPLFTSILRKVRAQEPCQVMSSFLDSFQSFIRAFKSVYTSDLLSKAENWKARELDAAKTKSKVSLIHDKFDTLVVLSKGFAKTDDVLRLLMRLKESRSGPIFATIHKAKGLESENIYILRPDLLSGFYASSEEQKQQEDNLHYVAITRAQAILTYGAER